MQILKDMFRTFWNLFVLFFALVICLIFIAAVSFACTFGAKLGVQISQSDSVQQYVLSEEGK